MSAPVFNEYFEMLVAKYEETGGYPWAIFTENATVAYRATALSERGECTLRVRNTRTPRLGCPGAGDRLGPIPVRRNPGLHRLTRAHRSHLRSGHRRHLLRFSARVAGNIVNGDLLGSMEFACRLAGSKAIVVLGHTSCGAVKGAISAAELGNLTGLVQKIEPAVAAVDGERDANDAPYVDAVAETNVRMVLEQIRSDSPVLAEMESSGEIALVGAMYDVSSGEVRWL